MRIAIVATLLRPHALEIVRTTVTYARAVGAEVRLTQDTAAVLHEAGGVAEELLMPGADLAIAIGGDGTMLGAVRAAAPHGVPVLGINAGALGFLTAITPEQLPVMLPLALRGEFTVETRSMLRGVIMHQGVVSAEMTALNDIVVRQGRQGRLINLDVTVAGRELGRFSADGLLISTPTGSTAYGLSAGGPIIHPSAAVTVLVPICPHSLSFRPMVFPASDPMVITCEGNFHGDEILVIADGQDPLTVSIGDQIVITPAPCVASLVKIDQTSFYDRLREKLQWGGG